MIQNKKLFTGGLMVGKGLTFPRGLLRLMSTSSVRRHLLICLCQLSWQLRERLHRIRGSAPYRIRRERNLSQKKQNATQLSLCIQRKQTVTEKFENIVTFQAVDGNFGYGVLEIAYFSLTIYIRHKTAAIGNKYGEMTSQNLWPRYARHLA